MDVGDEHGRIRRQEPEQGFWHRYRRAGRVIRLSLAGVAIAVVTATVGFAVGYTVPAGARIANYWGGPDSAPVVDFFEGGEQERPFGVYTVSRALEAAFWDCREE